ncbi:MAG TPA: deoxyribose-phosphate aldolase [Parafilimonas sp.]|nr:deoxyribose-phosphate aldolase [Parafilimonas sp.]
MQLNKYIDHTALGPAVLLSQIETLCGEAVEHDFAAVCVPPPMVASAKNFLEGSAVRVATVIGFPFGYSAIEAKIAEIVLAIVDGVDELDMVINILALKNNDWQFLANEINHVMRVVKQKNKVIKVIVESGLLSDEEIIRCCELYGNAGVDFLKTSTGYASVGATVHAVQLMRSHLLPHVQIKASGGIRSYAFAKELLDAGATRLGTSNSLAVIQQTFK